MKILGSILLAVIIVIGGLLAYLGFFSSVEVKEQRQGPYTFVYEKHVGDYQETGKIYTKISDSLKQDGIEVEAARAIGIYYDDPSKVEKNQRRSVIGFIVEESTPEIFEDLLAKYEVKSLSSTLTVYADFPFKNKLSIHVGMLKVFPAMDKYIKEKGYAPAPFVEVYDIENKVIEYMLPVENQEDFEWTNF